MVSLIGLLFAYKGNHFFANKQISCCFSIYFGKSWVGLQFLASAELVIFFGKEHIFFLMAFCQRQRTD